MTQPAGLFSKYFGGAGYSGNRRANYKMLAGHAGKPAIYAVDIAQQIENLFSDTEGQKTVPRDVMIKALEQVAFLNRKVLAVARFAARAKFKLDSENIETDLAAFVTEYIESIAKASGYPLPDRARNEHPGFPLRFKPFDASIVVNNLINNSRRAKASRIKFDLELLGKTGLLIRVSDNGRGLAPGVDRDRIFEMGYTSTRGSGLGLYHVRQVLGDIGGSIELEARPNEGISLREQVCGGYESHKMRIDFNHTAGVTTSLIALERKSRQSPNRWRMKGSRSGQPSVDLWKTRGPLLADGIFNDEIDLVLLDSRRPWRRRHGRSSDCRNP